MLIGKITPANFHTSLMSNNIKDQDITDALVGQTVKVLHENEWAIEDKEYFNTTLEEYKTLICIKL